MMDYIQRRILGGCELCNTAKNSANIAISQKKNCQTLLQYFNNKLKLDVMPKPQTLCVTLRAHKIEITVKNFFMNNILCNHQLQPDSETI